MSQYSRRWSIHDWLEKGSADGSVPFANVTADRDCDRTGLLEHDQCGSIPFNRFLLNSRLASTSNFRALHQKVRKQRGVLGGQEEPPSGRDEPDPILARNAATRPVRYMIYCRQNLFGGVDEVGIRMLLAIKAQPAAVGVG
jgi:hypothetical protein